MLEVGAKVGIEGVGFETLGLQSVQQGGDGLLSSLAGGCAVASSILVMSIIGTFDL